MQTYQGANYQLDFINYLKKKHKLYFYGPGFDIYSEDKNLDDVLSIFDNKPDIIFVGHSWLNDKYGKSVELKNNIDLSKTKLLKLFFLNKEYVNLEKKLDYCNKNNFDICFTHHHNFNEYTKKTNTNFHFIPFAFDKDKFKKIDKNYQKYYDIGFSGIVQNSNINSGQTDIRRRITKKLYYSLFDIPFIKKRKNLNIFWNIIPQNNISKKISQFFKIYKYYSVDQYIKRILMSKIYINTLSPYQLISPRYFETLASGTILLCQESEIYKQLFKDDFEYFTFRNDLQDFDTKINYILNDYKRLESIINRNKVNVYEKHSWENRVISITKIIENY